MASTKGYLDFVLGQLAALEGVGARAMMGEYLISFGGKVCGGVYDDRLLLKPTAGALALMAKSAFGVQMQSPYPGAKDMLAADVDDTELTCRVIRVIADELPEPKKPKGFPRF